MNDRKICFISCVNDTQQYQECLRYLHALEVPEGYQIETVGVENAPSMTAGYNHAMQQSDAKYKVYLHQDVRIINKQFLQEIISLFESNAELGLVGMVGAAKLPANGVWWESHARYGVVYESHTGTMQRLAFQDVLDGYQEVEALDGLILITQYDVPWRDDLFQGWHFYDLSQCAEFRKAGYKVGVPHQDKPWCLHDCGIVNVSNGFEEYRNVYLQEYAEMVQDREKQIAKDLPLVSVVIPAYNRPHYLELALQSVLAQTYPNIEIIISDDSTNDEVERMIQPYLKQYPQIRYFHNEQNLGDQNWSTAFERSKGEFVNFLNDDDLFHERKIEKMMTYFLAHEDLSLVTSYRKLIDEQGQVLNDMVGTRPLFERDTKIGGREFGDYMLSLCQNVIGEPTTVLFRRKDLVEPIAVYHQKAYTAIGDLASWLLLLSRGSVYYVAEPLSYFRQHQGQKTKSARISAHAIREWLQLIEDAHQNGYLQDESLYRSAILHFLLHASMLVNEGLTKEDLPIFRDMNVAKYMHTGIDKLFA